MGDYLLAALVVYAVLLVIAGPAVWALFRQAARLDRQDEEEQP